jgi:NAD(P)-dependent dehydrogenase (short-subunit alcohol dehydrogenase family)
MTGELSGKVVIITGAAGSIGSGCARRAAAEGAMVVASDLPGSRVADLVADVVRSGGTTVAHQGDVSEEQDVVAMVQTAVREFGRVDALINVAAAINLTAMDGDIAEMDVALWDRTMAVNLRGPMLGCKHTIPIMVGQGGGSIVNFASTATFLADKRRVAYASSKAALLGLTRGVATTYGKRGIRCNAVAPGAIWSDAAEERVGSRSIVEATRLTPRLGVPDDVAHMVVYLCSDKSTYVTGQTFLVDGGGTAHQPWVGFV